MLVVVGYVVAWIVEPPGSGGSDPSNDVFGQALFVVWFGGPAAAGAGIVLGVWRRLHRSLAWVATLLTAGYLWLIALFTGFFRWDLTCTGDACNTTSGMRIMPIAAVLALIALARAIELAVARWRGA